MLVHIREFRGMRARDRTNTKNNSPDSLDFQLNFYLFVRSVVRVIEQSHNLNTDMNSFIFMLNLNFIRI